MRTIMTGICIAAAAFAMDAAATDISSSVSERAAASSLTVVLANQEDPYYELAREIALEESLILASTLGEALDHAPDFLLWVVTPERLSDKRLADFGVKMRQSGHSAPVGIITGRSEETARQLYRRSREIQANRILIVNTENRPSHRKAGIIRLGDANQETIALTKEALLTRLRSTDYLIYSGHGSATQYTLDEARRRIRSQDLPELPPLIVESRGCQTLRIWERNSIALGFVDQGAAAYAGYFISPMSGWGLKGQAPLRFSWSDFPIGRIVSVMDKAVQCNARVPCFYLLGDPRGACQSAPPYVINDDRVQGRTRIIFVNPTASGVLPLRVVGGACYDFAAIDGITSVSRSDLFSNARLQMADFGEDKYLLYDSDGSDFVCTLAVHAPALWRLSDPILDSLDSALLTIYAPDCGTYFFLAGIGCLGLALALLKMRVGTPPARSIRLAMLTGMVVASCHGLYALFRLNEVTVTANPVQFYPVSVISTFVMTACGALFNFSSKSWWGRAAGAALGAGVSLFASLFVLLAIAVVNALIFSRVGFAPWRSSLALSMSIAFTLQCGLCLVVIEGLRRSARKRK